MTFNSYHTANQVPRTRAQHSPATQRQLATQRSGLVPNTFYTPGGMTNVNPNTIKLAQKAADAVAEREQTPMSPEDEKAWAQKLAEDGTTNAESEWKEEQAMVENPKVDREYGEFEDVVQFMKTQGIAVPPSIQDRIDEHNGTLSKSEADYRLEENGPETVEGDEYDEDEEGGAPDDGIQIVPGGAEPIASAALKPRSEPLTEEVMPGNVVPSLDRPGTVRVMEPRSTQPPPTTTKPTLVPPGTGRNVVSPEVDTEGNPYPLNAPIEGAINLHPSARPPIERGPK